MHLKFTQTIMEGQEFDNPIAALSWAPNNKKLAVATYDRIIILFDDTGVKRDKFNTKPADANAGKKSYCIVALAFSADSEMLGVAQSDSIVFVYRIGAGWGGKKVICNKFSLKAPATMLLWSLGFFVSGQLDGKIRILDCKTNKASTVWSGATACVSLTLIEDSVSETGSMSNVISGHYDGSIFVGGSSLIKHPVPPTILCILDNNIVAGGCDGRIFIYDMNTGRILRNIDKPNLPQPEQKDLIVAAGSPGGQVAVLGAWDGCVVLEARAGVSGSVACSAPLLITSLGSARALAWSHDGAYLAIGSPSGAVLIFEAILRRWVWRGSVEVRHVAPKRIMLSRLSQDVSPLSVETKLGTDIYSVKIMGNDWYAVCRTNVSLILCDLGHGLVSEVKWPAGGGEKFSMQVAQACLIYRAGELFVIEYGHNSILATVRTERVNPHVLSVRLNEGKTKSDNDNKKLAYLLDKQTVAIVDLLTGVQILQVWHDARINWLELSESAQLLLLRDSKKRLILIDTSNGKKDVILSGVGFVQWVEDSDAVVAQTPTHIAVWYCMEDPGSVELVEAGGGLAVGVDVGGAGSTRVLLQSGSITHIELDQARLKFNGSLREDDLEGCVSYLGSLGDSPQLASLWQKLADRAMNIGDLKLAIKCYKALGDDARAFFLDKTIKMAQEDENNDGYSKLADIPVVRARLAMLSRDLPTAAQEWLAAGKPDNAIDAYRLVRRWTDAVALAERNLPFMAAELRDAHFAYLNATERYGEAGGLLAARGDIEGALSLWVSKGKARRAARLLLSSSGRPARDRAAPVLRALVASRCFEPAGELAERLGDADAAIRYYAEGECYARAVQLAREALPEAVAGLERRWGDWLRASRRGGAGAAVAHYIEAGDTRAALAAAVDAKHYKKALQIVQVIDDVDSVKDYYEKISDYYISIQEWETAEKLLVAAGLTERCVTAYNTAGKYAEGLRLALRYMDEEKFQEMYATIAATLKSQGQLRQAETVYCGLGEFDEAIAMYKEAGNYEAMVRLVGAHRPDLLPATRRHLATQLQNAGQLRQAENHYLQAGDWKNVIQMYRNANQWEDADRVAQQYAPPQVQQQVVFLWAAALGGAAGARLVARRGLLAAGARWACAARRWQLALALAAHGAPIAATDVHAHMARALQADGELDEAEAAYIRSGNVGDAIAMRMQTDDYPRALSLAEQHVTDKVNDVLQAYAIWAADQGDLSLYEALMIRANKPHDVINYYKENDMWPDALRVCSEYVPGALRSLRSEAARAGHHAGNTSLSPQDVPELLQTASQYANSGSYWEAVSALLSASGAAASGGGSGAAVAERAAVRAARLARDHLVGADRARAASLVYERLAAIGQESVGEQLKNALLSNQADEYDDESNGEGDGTVGRSSSASAGESAASGGDIELAALARRGDWSRCLQLAKMRGAESAARWAAAHAASLLQESPSNPRAAIETLTVHGATAAGALAGDLLAAVSSLMDPPFDLLRDLRDILLSMFTQETIYRSGSRMVEAVHLRTVTLACSSAALKPLGVRASVALLRYTDIIIADQAFYTAGEMLKSVGRSGEAFVFLNRYLDLAEAAEEGNDSSSLDHTDFECTDFPHGALLSASPTLSPELHEEVREWVLTASMDNTVEQTLPIDSRGLYESSLSGNEEGCILTGYPLGTKRVNFTNGRAANRDAWSKLQVASSSEPGSHAADIYRFVLVWCGQSDYTLA